jgi:hypothetical protein
VSFKNGGELGDFQQIAHARFRVGQRQFAMRPASCPIDAHQRAQAGAVNVLNARKIKDNTLVGGSENNRRWPK